MANVLVEKQSLVDAANAIRTQLGSHDPIAPEDFDAKISEISGGGGGGTDEDPGDYGMVWFWPKLQLIDQGYEQKGGSNTQWRSGWRQ